MAVSVVMTPKPHNWCSNVSTQNWCILLWIPTQWCTPTGPYHRLCDKNWVPDERITSCPLLVGVKDTQKNDNDPDDVVCSFIDKYITAVIPPIAPENEHDMKLMENPQKHTHSDYCHRNKSCHSGFPKLPSTKTLISRSPIDDNDEIIENAKSVLQTVQNKLTTIDIHNISTQHFLQDINLDIETSINALKISKRGPNGILQWNPQEVFINACNHDILSLWGGNVDLQYVIQEIATVKCLHYMTKGGKGMGENTKKSG